MGKERDVYQVAEGVILGAPVVAVMVEVEALSPVAANRLLARLQPFFPTKPIVLVCPVGDRIFSCATFDSDPVAAALGEQDLDWYALDLSQAPDEDERLPF